jgi:hypothetical protein
MMTICGWNIYLKYTQWINTDFIEITVVFSCLFTVGCDSLISIAVIHNRMQNTHEDVETKLGNQITPCKESGQKGAHYNTNYFCTQ